MPVTRRLESLRPETRDVALNYLEVHGEDALRQVLMIDAPPALRAAAGEVYARMGPDGFRHLIDRVAPLFVGGLTQEDLVHLEVVNLCKAAGLPWQLLMQEAGAKPEHVRRIEVASHPGRGHFIRQGQR